MSQFPHISAGDPLPRRADLLNAQVRAAADFANRPTGQAGRSFATGNPAVIRIKNNSGSNVPKYGVLGLGDVQVDHATNPDAFLQRVYMDGESPHEAGSESSVGGVTRHDRRHAVATQAIRDGEIGFACVQGMIQVQVEMQETWHDYAVVIRGDVDKLTSAPVGTTKILWKAADTGTQWCIVDVGSALPDPTYANITAEGSSSGFFEAAEYRLEGWGLSSAGLKATGRNFTTADMGELAVDGFSDLAFSSTSGGSDALYLPVYWRRTPNTNDFHPHAVNIFRERGSLIQVRLSSTSGSAGDASTRASFVYEATDLNTTRVLQTGINPNTGSSSDYARPTVGKMVAATYGWGYWASGGTFTLAGCNEYLDMQAVDVVTDSDPAETKSTIASPGVT